MSLACRSVSWWEVTLPYRSPPSHWLQISLELINVVTLNPIRKVSGNTKWQVVLLFS